MVAILVTATTAMNEFKKSSHTNTLLTIYYRSFDNWRLFHQPTPTPTSPQQKSNKKISLWHIGNWELLPTATTWYHMKESAKENEKATTVDPYLFGEEEDGWEGKEGSEQDWERWRREGWEDSTKSAETLYGSLSGRRRILGPPVQNFVPIYKKTSRDHYFKYLIQTINVKLKF